VPYYHRPFVAQKVQIPLPVNTIKGMGPIRAGSIGIELDSAVLLGTNRGDAIAGGDVQAITDNS